MTLISLDTGRWPAGKPATPAEQFAGLLEGVTASHMSRQRALGEFARRPPERQRIIVERLNAQIDGSPTSLAAFYQHAGMYNPEHGRGLTTPTTGAWKNRRYGI